MWSVFCFTVFTVVEFLGTFSVHALRGMWQNVSRACKYVEQIFQTQLESILVFEAGDLLTVRPSRYWFVNNHHISHCLVWDELMF
jgi:hypothetical protein